MPQPGLTIPDLLSRCAAEPIHIPGAIQPHGFLLSCDRDGRIRHASATCGQWLGVEAAALIGQSLGRVIDARSQRDIDLLARSDALAQPATLAVVLAATRSTIAVRLHRRGAALIIEHERSSTEDDAAALPRLAAALETVARTTEEAPLLTQVVAAARDLAGYDRVMIYRFHPDDHGEVVAESLAEGQDPLIGLHYPAGDIPSQARALYLHNRLRVIPDAVYSPVSLITDGNLVEPLDLSLCHLRSVSPVHLEYLANMGVRATMVASLVVEGRLWGLIALHHHQGPRLPGAAIRAAIELLAGALAGRLADLAALARVRARQQAERWVLTGSDLAAVPRLLGAEGLAVALHGLTPSVVGIPVATAAVLQTWAVGGEVKATDSCERDLPAAGACGALGISPAPGMAVICTRPVGQQVRNWAGDPSKPVLGTDDRPSPRRSFALWQEDIRTSARPWDRADREILDAVTRELAARAMAADPLPWRLARWALVLIGADGRLEWSNDTLLRWCGRTTLGQDPLDPLASFPSTSSFVLAALRDAISRRRRARLDLPLAGPRTRWLDISVHPQADGRVVLVAEDATALREAQRAVAQAAEATAEAVCRRSLLVRQLGCELPRTTAGSWRPAPASPAEIVPLQSAVRRLLGTGNSLAPAFLRLVDAALARFGLLPRQQDPVAVPSLLADLSAALRPVTDGRGLALTIGISPDAPRMLTGDAQRIRDLLLDALLPFLGPGIEFPAMAGSAGGIAIQASGVPGQPGRLRVAITGVVSGPAASLDPEALAILDALGGIVQAGPSSMTLEFPGSP